MPDSWNDCFAYLMSVGKKDRHGKAIDAKRFVTEVDVAEDRIVEKLSGFFETNIIQGMGHGEWGTEESIVLYILTDDVESGHTVLATVASSLAVNLDQDEIWVTSFVGSRFVARGGSQSLS